LSGSELSAIFEGEWDVQVIPSWLSETGPNTLREKDLFLNSGGLRIHAVLNSKGPIASRPAVVLIHGLRSDCDELEHLATAIARFGWTALRLDLRGNGLSEGHYDDINGYVHDTHTGVDYLLSKGIDPNHIFLVGQSFGSAVAITAGAFDKRVSGVVALHPSCTHDLGAYNPPRGHTDVRRPLNSVALISPRPLLIIAGESDMVLPCSKAEELYDAALEPKRMLEIKDGTHAMEDTEAYALGWLLAGAPHV
jgi:uncharacterized protein